MSYTKSKKEKKKFFFYTSKKIRDAVCNQYIELACRYIKKKISPLEYEVTIIYDIVKK